ncbi:MAG: RsmE family RNA methyltransferase [Chloroflexota bacterium]
MHRFFVPPERIEGKDVSLAGGIAHQLRHVLRLRPGDSIVVLDNTGWEYIVELRSLQGESARGEVLEKRQAQGEPKVEITLYQALLKGNKFEYVIQKGTEIGISRFVPLLCQRSVALGAGGAEKTRATRWRRIIREAAEQSGRGTLPVLEPPVTFSEACQQRKGLSLLPCEGEERLGIRAALSAHHISTLSIFIGPEGGFSTEEVEEARSHAILPVTLGRRILRAETAALVAATVVLFECGEI